MAAARAAAAAVRAVAVEAMPLAATVAVGAAPLPAPAPAARRWSLALLLAALLAVVSLLLGARLVALSAPAPPSFYARVVYTGDSAEQKEAMALQKAFHDVWKSLPLAIVREAANDGDAAAQAVLGQHYDDGSKGLPNPPSLRLSGGPRLHLVASQMRRLARLAWAGYTREGRVLLKTRPRPSGSIILLLSKAIRVRNLIWAVLSARATAARRTPSKRCFGCAEPPISDMPMPRPCLGDGTVREKTASLSTIQNRCGIIFSL